MNQNDRTDAREQSGRRQPQQRQPPREQFRRQYQHQYPQQGATRPVAQQSQAAPARQVGTRTPQQPRQQGAIAGQQQPPNPQGSVQSAGGVATQPPQASGRQVGPTPADGPRLRATPVEEILQTDPVTAAPETPVRTVVAKMSEMEVGSVVVTDGGAPVGILTDREIALALVRMPDVADRQAGELLGGDLVTGSTEMTVFQALDALRESGIRRLPVVDEEGALRGIVTLDDILVLLGSELSDATEIIRSQSPRL